MSLCPQICSSDGQVNDMCTCLEPACSIVVPAAVAAGHAAMPALYLRHFAAAIGSSLALLHSRVYSYLESRLHGRTSCDGKEAQGDGVEVGQSCIEAAISENAVSCCASANAK
jgi:hypothetical protein